MVSQIGSHEVCAHANIRAAQRGVREADISLALDTAAHVSPEAYMFTNASVQRAIQARKKEIASLERLKGSKFVISDGVLVTVYWPTRANERRTLRRGRLCK